jgi:GNAT superfamily N-acetyltransferase
MGIRELFKITRIASRYDSDTAKIVAFNVQKLARQLDKAVLVATTHTDLFKDLKPSVWVHKRFGREIAVRYFPNKMNPACTLVKETHVEEGARQDYEKLACFHYRSSRLPAPLKIFALKHRKETVGVIVYSYSPSTCFGRRQALGRVASMDELNRDFAWISRVVLNPKYRSVGLGTMLVKETLPMVGRRFVEAIAVMAKYNPFFEKAGMQKIAERKPSQGVLKALTKLHEFGFNPVFLASERHNQMTLSRLDSKQVRRVKKVLLNIPDCPFKRLAGAGFSNKPFLPRDDFAKILKNANLERLALMLCNLSVLTQTKVYLFWTNHNLNSNLKNSHIHIHRGNKGKRRTGTCLNFSYYTTVRRVTQKRWLRQWQKAPKP